jgi:hypothetical protein
MVSEENIEFSCQCAAGSRRFGIHPDTGKTVSRGSVATQGGGGEYGRDQGFAGNYPYIRESDGADSSSTELCERFLVEQFGYEAAPKSVRASGAARGNGKPTTLIRQANAREDWKYLYDNISRRPPNT